MNRASRMERFAGWVLAALASPYERDALIGDVLERYRAQRNVLTLVRDVLFAVGLGVAHRVRRHGVSFAGALLAAWAIHVVLHLISFGGATRVSAGAHDLVLRAASGFHFGGTTSVVATAAGVMVFAGWVLGVALACGYAIGQIHHAYRRFAMVLFAAFAAYPGAATALKHLVGYLDNPRVGWDASPMWHQSLYALAAIVGVFWGGRSSRAAVPR
jgi:hypothetical protein